MRTLSLLLIVLLYATGVKAQNPKNYYVEEPRTFFGGLILGANFTQVDGDSYAGYRNVGLNTGVIVYAQLAPKVAASLELLFSQKGARSNGPQPSSSKAFLITKQNITLNYAEIPVQINYFDKHKSHFGAGLSYSRLVGSKETIQTSPDQHYKADEYPFKKSDLNFIIGGQLHLKGGFFAGLRFQYSILSIRDDVDREFGRSEQFNNMFALRLMYLF
jgi:hypothetical protein